MAPAPVVPGPTIRFGEDYELDVRACEVRRSGRVLKLERIPVELLLLLIEHRGEVVTREQIVERIWGKGVFLDTDNSINGAVRKIRRVLRDNPEQPRFVQTVTGKGYRFIAPVDIPPQGDAAISNRQSPAAESETPRPVRRAWWWLVPGAAVVLAIYLLWSGSQSRHKPPNGRLMLAVLPFENLTGDTTQEYFSDGLTEELIAQLGRLDPQRVGVIARTSVMTYKQQREPLDRIGSKLGVHYVLEGSVRRDSGRVRISAQLIGVKDQTHLWSQQYDRELGSLLALQREIAQAIVDEILATVGDKESVARASQPLPPAGSYDAYDLYLKGRYFWNKRTEEGFRQAVEYFQQAIVKDPQFARAYAGLADSYALMSSYNLGRPSELMPNARDAALRAVNLDESLAEAHTSLALISENYDWDWQAAEKEFRRAIQLNPNYATAHHWYAEFLAFQGRFDEALAESDRAKRLDPLSLIIASDHGAILYFSRQHDQAIEQFRAVLSVEPNFARAYMIVFPYVEKGMFAEALDAIENWRRNDSSPLIWALEAYVRGRKGEKAEARLALQRFEHASRNRRLDTTPMLVAAYAGIGDKDKAFSMLEESYRKHSHTLTAVKVDPIYDPLRHDPRFKQILRRVRLAN